MNKYQWLKISPGTLEYLNNDVSNIGQFAVKSVHVDYQYQYNSRLKEQKLD